MKFRLHSKNGFTARVGKEVQIRAHEDGTKMTAGENNYYDISKEGNINMKCEKEFVSEAKEKYWVKSKLPFVSTPWQIKSKDPEAKVKNDDQ